MENAISDASLPSFTTSNMWTNTVITIDKLLHNSANKIIYSTTICLKAILSILLKSLLTSEEVTISMSEYFHNSDTVRTLFKHSFAELPVIDGYSRCEKDENALMEPFRQRYSKNSFLDAISRR